MRRFTRLVTEIASTRSTVAKRSLLAAYFRDSPRGDVGRALEVLLERRPARRMPSGSLRSWVAEASGVPEWLVTECQGQVGDLSETIALLVPDVEMASNDDPGLDETVRRYVIAPEMSRPETARTRLFEAWRRFGRDERFVLHKLLGGAFRIGVAKGLTINALADVANVPPATMAHRLAGRPVLDEAGVERILAQDAIGDEATRPYPFALASPLDSPPTTEGLGPISEWQIEPKWDGMRGQLLKRDGTTTLWSRGDESLGASFPELIAAATELPDGTVLDGEILAMDGGRPLGFHHVQRRIGAKSVEPSLFGSDFVFVCFDLLEEGSEDLREVPLVERRRRLDALLPAEPRSPLRVGRMLSPESWADAEAIRKRSRDDGVEGLVLKRRCSEYFAGRVRGHWWKWKIEPFTADLVVTAAQLGHGRRASLYTDYTFAAWDGIDSSRRLVTVTKAYSGLDDAEIASIDREIRRSTTARRGPVRLLEPSIVMEVGFEAVQLSGRHQAGIALRFPRIKRIRNDKRIDDADDLHTLRAMIRE